MPSSDPLFQLGWKSIMGALGVFGLTSFVAGIVNFDLPGFKVTPQILGLEVAAHLTLC